MDNMKKTMLAQKLMDSINENSAFAQDFAAAQDAPSIRKVLQKNGFDFTPEEVNELYAEGAKELEKLRMDVCDELSEDDLDNVAGGGIIRGTLRLVVTCGVAVGYGALCYVCPAAMKSAYVVAVGMSLWTAEGYKKKGW